MRAEGFDFLEGAPVLVGAVEVGAEYVVVRAWFDAFAQEEACGVGEGVEASLGVAHGLAFY